MPITLRVVHGSDAPVERTIDGDGAIDTDAERAAARAFVTDPNDTILVMNNGGNGVLQVLHGSDVGATASRPLPVDWVRGGYRMTGALSGSPIFSHGFQIQAGVPFSAGHGITLTPQLEMNNQFLYSTASPATLSQSAVLGQHVPGVRSVTYDGVTYTDENGGLNYKTNNYFMELIPEILFAWRPSQSIPIAIGARLAMGITYTSTHSHVVVHNNDPYGTQHTGSNGCIPGDIHCGAGPIPTPTFNAADYTLDSDADQWALYARGGLRILFPVNDYVTGYTEYLFRGNQASSVFDMLWRSAVSVRWPIGRNFLLLAEPRYIMTVTPSAATTVTHGFDLFAGAQARF